MPHAYSVGFCSNVEHFKLFLFVRQLWSKLLMTHFIITVSIPRCPTCSEYVSSYVASTNFLSLTDYDMLQLLIVLYLNFLTRQQLTLQRPGNLLRQSQVGSWSWNETHLKMHKTVIIDTDNLHHQAARWTSSELVMFSCNCSVLLIMFIYLELLTDYRYLCFVQQLILLCNLMSFTSCQNVGCIPQAG